MSTPAATPARLPLMRAASLAEASTLAALVFVAMPLKYMAHHPEAVSLMGAIHGITFLAYLACLAVANASGGWSRGLVALAFVAAFIPLGGFAYERHLARIARQGGAG